MSAQYVIKRADSHGELEAGVRVNALAWQESFRGLLADEVIDTRATDEAMTERAAIWAASSLDGAHFWLASDRADGHAVGIAHACPARDAEAPTALELAMLYVLDEAKGTGLADALLNTALGDAPAYLWTLAGYDRSIAFYHRHGFRLDGITRRAEHLAGPGMTQHAPNQVRMTRLASDGT